MQLQQKLLQLQTALSGQQDAAHVLLRRCPATPLMLCSSKNVQAQSTALQSPGTGDSGSLIFSSRKASNEGLSSSQKPGVSGHNFDKLSTETITASHKKKHRPQPKITNLPGADHYGDCVSSQEADPEHPALPTARVVLVKAEGSEKMTVPAKEEVESLRQRSRSEGKDQAGKDVLTGCPSDLTVTIGYSENTVKMPESSIEQLQNNTVLFLQENASDISSVKSSSLIMEDSDSEDMSQNLDIPKHPFLRRKSKAMPPQKLDWSKVKPMVSSRLEPELKTRLLKAKFRGTALFRKRNFTQIKSRLFSYEKSGPEENDDTTSVALFKHNVAEGSLNNRTKQLLLQVHAEVQPVVMNMSSSNPKAQNSKRPSMRYSRKEDSQNITKEAVDADLHTDLVSCPSQKMKGDKRTEVSAPQPSCKENKFVAAENQPESQTHLKRCGSPNVSPDVWGSEASPDSSANCERTREVRKGDFCFSKHVELPQSELEKMFDHVINNQGGDATLAAYFGVNQQDSIVPRLSPNSSVFQSSRHQMTQIHQLLSKEGRAGRLQHNCLSFVSIRD